MSMGRLLHLLASLGLVLFGTTVALFGSEAIARLFAPQWAPQHAERSFWRYDPLLGWAHRPGQRGMLRHPDFEVSVEISDQGFRDHMLPLGRVPGKRRMLVLGDSFAWGFGVERAEILWKILEARHPDWEILNTAVSGYGTGQQLLFLEERGAAFQPDVVVLHFHPNDVEDAADDRRYGYPKPQFSLTDVGLVLGNVPVPELSIAWRAQRWLRENSYLFNRLQAVRQLLASGEIPRMRAAGVAASGDELEHDMRLTDALLRRLSAGCHKIGARLVVVSNPSPDPIRGALARTLADLDVPYGPLDAAFRGQPRDEIKFANDPHWTPVGQRIAADAVEEFLIASAVLP
jgi:hypothetical protein